MQGAGQCTPCPPLQHPPLTPFLCRPHPSPLPCQPTLPLAALAGVAAVQHQRQQGVQEMAAVETQSLCPMHPGGPGCDPNAALLPALP
eukprot:CAMPEP_0202413154 /NCGR_PEP_ID=MMETSP1128-20130828/28345_1 /ASSEMBLY_ACC=CAM_ASM_000463 /TAXON_ID=3047 /ORGANISM="Dunaliella tertiolecta, Strain CCMP1320" /LENGTH=87 /DNA_ID=CAMNT_0049019251 /DNA_START=1 /DNA_END=261 /DNA_ORIENTATION=-